MATSGREFSRVAFEIVVDLGPVLARAEAGGALVAIDVPIGLSEDGPRACDVSARRLLGAPRASSVFPAPGRAALGSRTYEEACESNRRQLGVAISRQCFGILDKIDHVDHLMTPARQALIREVHPEVVFAILSGSGRGLGEPKRTAAGERARRELLREVAPAFDPGLVRVELGPSRVARNDIVDAVACLVVARRVVEGRSVVLPSGDAPRDARGLRMEIVA